MDRRVVFAPRRLPNQFLPLDSLRGKLMPAAKAFSQTSQFGPFDDDASDSWSMPVVRLGQTQFNVAYSVFVALAVLAAVTAVVTPREGNGDIPIVMLVSIGLWITGWLVQVVSALAIFWWLRCPCKSLTIGLWGVEGTRRAWTASQCVAMVAATLFTLLLLGVSLLIVDFTLIGKDVGSGLFLQNLLQTWSTPSLGLADASSIIQTASWLCFIQVLCQSLPFPTTLGRLGLIATVSMADHQSDPRIQTRHARMAIRVIAIVILAAALAMLVVAENQWRLQWPMLMVLSLILWITSYAHDVSEQVSSFHELSDEQILQWLDSEDAQIETDSDSTAIDHRGPMDAVAKLKGAATTWNQRRKARRAMEREHAEADDELRLDAVLERLHANGHESLSYEDRALLMRVSRTLQRHRGESATEEVDNR
jgi:hypothetical protein